MKRWIATLILGVAAAAPAVAGNANDDLQAVRKAVLATSVSQARPPAEDPGGASAEARPRERGKHEPMWFRVRISEKSGKRGRVSINLPLTIARSMGDDWPIRSSRCHKTDRCGVTLGELLRALDGGQNLVEIESDDASVRVWVD